MTESKSVVIASLVANAAIAVLKFGGFLLTGSAAMLSETYHSISDTGNQVFLLMGIRASGREPTRSHPFGYGKAQFFYSFLVSVLLFGIAGWESLKEGYNALAHHEAHVGGHAVHAAGFTFPSIYVNYGVLLGAFCLEGYSLWAAYKSTRREIRENEWSGFVEAFRKTSRVSTLTSLTENTVAIIGIVLAFLGVYLARTTGNPMYDGVAALLIGVLLMGFALALALENKRLLIGESLPSEEERRLEDALAGYESVSEVVEFRTVYFGPDNVFVAADVAFDEGLDADAIGRAIAAIEGDLREKESSIGRISIEPAE